MSLERRRSKEIDEILKKIEPRFERAFRQALDDIKSEMKIKEIADLINAGQFSQAVALINEATVSAAMIAFNKEIQNAVQAGGDIAAKWARADKIVFDLNVTESNTARYINSYQADKVRQTTQLMQKVMGEVVLDGTNAGQNPIKVARRMRDSVGLTSNQERAVKNFEKLLRERKSEALTRALRDKRFDRSIISAITNERPLTEKQIAKMVGRYREKYVKYRAETIARTEAIRLLNFGQQQFWQQAINDGKVAQDRLIKKWIPTYDGRLREAHASIPRMNPDGVGFTDAFQSPLGPIRFPGDPQGVAANVINCRCSTFYRVKTGVN